MGREGEREGEKHQYGVAPCVPLLGTWPATQAFALTGNQTGSPLVCRPMLNPLSYTNQGPIFLITEEKYLINKFDKEFHMLLFWRYFYF